LVQFGAQRPEPSGAETFLAAAMQGDTATLRRLAGQHPEFLKGPNAMFAAIRQHRTDIAELLLDMGASPDVAHGEGFSGLHFTTHCGAVGIATLLIERGANVDAIERRYHSTPLGHANYQGRTEMVAVIAPFSRDIRGLCFAGTVDRLAELFAMDSSLASAVAR